MEKVFLYFDSWKYRLFILSIENQIVQYSIAFAYLSVVTLPPKTRELLKHCKVLLFYIDYVFTGLKRLLLVRVYVEQINQLIHVKSWNWSFSFSKNLFFIVHQFLQILMKTRVYMWLKTFLSHLFYQLKVLNSLNFITGFV